MDNLTPVTVFSGYLGAGKTTIILKTLAQYTPPPLFALIKNEYGDVSVDGALLQLGNIQVKELVNGCLCCVLVGSLNAAVDEIVDTLHPERILIEASGNALPFPIVLELKKNRLVYVDGVVWVVDCVNFSGIKDKSVVAREQAKYTDLIVFNKTGLVDEKTLYQVKEDVYDLNPDTKSIDTADGAVPPFVLFGLPHDTHRGFADEQAVTHEHDELETFVFESTATFDRAKVQQVLGACEHSAFYRIKGFIADTTEGWQLINWVFGRLEMRPMAMPPGAVSRVVFIGKKIKKFEPMIRDYLTAATRPA